MHEFTAVLDRISDGIAVFVTDGGRTVTMKAVRLPDGLTEGCVVRLGCTACGAPAFLGTLPEETAARHDKARRAFEKLKNREIEE